MPEQIKHDLTDLFDSNARKGRHDCTISEITSSLEMSKLSDIF